jgi:hypothetical protein
VIRRCAALALLLLAAACGKPLPPEKAAYVGDWGSRTMSLRIAQEGTVAYKRVSGNVTTSVNGPIQRFEGDNFVVGIPGLTTTFVVSRAPLQQEGRWTMVVDGVELTRGR